MMPNQEQEVIILGVTHHNTLGVIRALGESSHHYRCVLVLYGEKNSYLSQSIYVKNTYYVDKAENITDVLLSIASNEKKVIITVTDEAARQLDLHSDSLSSHYIFFRTCIPGELTCYMDKYRQDEIAKEIGMSVPENYTSENIKFPCLLKPLASINGGKIVLICDNQTDYKKNIANYPNTTFQIQQCLKKEFEIVVVGLAVNDEVYIPSYVFKHREKSGGTNYSTVYPISMLDSNLVEKSKDLIRAIGYEGLFGIEYIYCNEQYWFIEVNLRTDATCYSVAVAGVNLPEAYVMAKQGENIKDIVSTPVRIIDSMVEFRDFEFVLMRRIGILKWLHQRKKCECLYFYSKTDKRPYQINKKLMRKRIINGLLKIFKVR